MDLMKLMMSDWKVDLVNDCVNEFTVLFKGPKDSKLSDPANGTVNLAWFPAFGQCVSCAARGFQREQSSNRVLHSRQIAAALLCACIPHNSS